MIWFVRPYVQNGPIIEYTTVDWMAPIVRANRTLKFYASGLLPIISEQITKTFFYRIHFIAKLCLTYRFLKSQSVTIANSTKRKDLQDSPKFMCKQCAMQTSCLYTVTIYEWFRWKESTSKRTYTMEESGSYRY